jgi:Chloride channel protein EriC
LVRDNPQYIPLLFLGLIVLGVLSATLIKKVPEVKGSGIPRTEGILRGLLTFKWLRIIIGTIIGSFLSFFGGLSLGNEGPSVQLGAATVEGTNYILRSKFAWRRYISTGGASAGIAVAFGAPITGVMFAIEEVQKQYNPLLLLSAVVTTFMATVMARLCSSVFGYEEFYFVFINCIAAIPVKETWMLLVVAVIIGIVAVLFNGLLLKKPLIKETKFSPYGRIISVFILSGTAGLIWLDSIGSGFSLIRKVATMDISLKLIVTFFIIKLVLITLGYRSGATGGLFVPMLCLGALLGGLLGRMCMAFGLSIEYYTTLVMICTVAFLGATIRTPFTALILLIETTQAMSGFYAAAVVIFLSCIVAEICMRKPLYDRLLEDEVENFNKDKHLEFSTFDKVVESNSFAENKYIRNILWPNKCRITSITRGVDTVVPDGKTLLTKGDILHLSSENYDAKAIEEELNGILSANRSKKSNRKK